MALRLFLSAGEPSGDLHGANLVRALQWARPGVQCVGFGGERMEAAGCSLLYPLTRLALMGLWPILRHLGDFVQLLRQAEASFVQHRPDAVILIDYPGFHWWLARRAKAHGIPVFYFVPPQLWAWAGWRVRKMRRSVDHVLCSLPFEEPWYRKRQVPAQYVGHPYFDELAEQQLNAAFVEEQSEGGGILIGLLPGSRYQELEWNLPTLLGAAERIHAARPETRFLVACLKEEHRGIVEQFLCSRQGEKGGWTRTSQGFFPPGVPASASHPVLEIHVGKTAEIIHLAKACIAVSGSVGLELLSRGTPSVVVYKGSWYGLLLARFLKTCRFISLVNLLADEEIFPELLSGREECEAAARHVLDWLENPLAWERTRARLAELKARVAIPGACARAARFVLDRVEKTPQTHAA